MKRNQVRGRKLDKCLNAGEALLFERTDADVAAAAAAASACSSDAMVAIRRQPMRLVRSRKLQPKQLDVAVVEQPQKKKAKSRNASPSMSASITQNRTMSMDIDSREEQQHHHQQEINYYNYNNNNNNQNGNRITDFRNQMDLIKSASRLHSWNWDQNHRSSQVSTSSLAV